MGAPSHGRSAAADRQPRAAPARFGRFELIERIGTGGMAEVFRAAVKGPEGFHREIVVKRILPELSARPRFTQMFVNEAKISALLNHPNIVQIFEFGESDGAYFIAMESVRGLTLREVLTRLRQQQRMMPVVAAAEITREVLIALDYAHNLHDADGRALDIVHRDISPSNIMLGDTGAVKVLDFGIARAADLTSDDEGKVVKGKIAYLAPEQISCGDIDARADLFAVGCVLHELLTGRVMFRAQNDLQKKVDLLAQETPPPSAWNGEVPPALDLVVARATARGPNARYTSAADMLADVENYLSSFRSSSRAVLRLVRSLAAAPASEVAVAPGRPGIDGAGASVSGGAAVPAVRQSDASTRPARMLAEDFAQSPGVPGPTRALPVERTDEGGSTSGRRGQVSARGAEAARLDGAGSAERRRFARGVWHRRLVMVGMAGLCLAVLGGVVAGGRALWGRVSQPVAGRTGPAAAGETFVLVTFTSTPPGARIVDGAGRVVGNTPATLPVTRSQIVVSFRFQLDGYAEAIASSVPNADTTVAVELKPAKQPEKPARKSRRARRLGASPGR
ncbi:MAG: serine/threonine-protein kinase [Myxococcales bacterium]